MRAKSRAAPEAGRRGPKIKQEKLSRFGAELYRYIAAKQWGHNEFADALNLEGAGRQVIGRMLRGQTRTFPFPLEALLRALEIPNADARAVYACVSELGLRFAVEAELSAPAVGNADTADGAPATAPEPEAPSRLVTIGVTHGWGFAESASDVERDVIRYLWLGDADYAGRRAREKYYQLIHSERFRHDRLPVELQKQWLLRFGAIIEQAEEMAGAWHADRVAASFQALRRMEADIARIDGQGLSYSGFGYDQAIILARKAALLRERYVDDRPLSQFYLNMSVATYEAALGELEVATKAGLEEFERRTLYPALTLALRFQRLHNDAARGDSGWIRKVRDLEAEHAPRGQARHDLYEAIGLYFKAMGYKRLAWALRPRPGQPDIFSGARATYYDEAGRYIAAFLASPLRDAAWSAANLRPFTLPDGQRSEQAQSALISPQQSSLLLEMSELEIAVWLRPDKVERQDPQLLADAARLYPALLAKLNNNRAFARALQGVAPQD